VRRPQHHPCQSKTAWTGIITDLRSPPVGSLDPKGRPKKPISPGTAQRVVHLLSAFYQWLGKHHDIATNPVRMLKGDGDIRDLLRSTHDPKRVPFLKRKEDVAALFNLGVPKSGKDRVVPIVPSLASVLKAWRKKNPKAELAAPSLRQTANGKTKFLNWRTVKDARKRRSRSAGSSP
jgi:integrase